MRFSSPRPPAKAFTASLVALATLSLAAVASAQNQYPVYSENFNSGYTVNNSTLSDQKGWVTNDEDTGGTYTYNTTQTGTIGQSDFVGYVGNFGGTSTANYSAALGGIYGQAAVPGMGAGYYPAVGVAVPSSVSLSQALPTTGAASLVFTTDFQITQPSAGLPKHDTFGFALTTGTPTANLVTGSTTVTPSISVNFAADAANETNFDNVNVNGGANFAGINLGTNTRYKLTVNVNVTVGTYNVMIQGENLTTGAITGTVGSFSGTYTGGAITGYAATWGLQDPSAVQTANNLANAGTNNQAHTDAGSNVLYFDNVVVTVPEPSTYAMVVLGVLGMAVMVRRVRRTLAA